MKNLVFKIGDIVVARDTAHMKSFGLVGKIGIVYGDCETEALPLIVHFDDYRDGCPGVALCDPTDIEFAYKLDGTYFHKLDQLYNQDVGGESDE